MNFAKEVQFGAYQRSDNFSNQWQQLTSAGDHGEQSAKYLEKMVAERRGLVDSYLRGFFDMSQQLATELDLENLNSVDLDMLIANVSAGRQASENSDGSLLPQAEMLNQFWTENKQQLSELQQNHADIYNLPTHLSQWLDQNNIDRPLEVDILAEKFRYSAFNGQAGQPQALAEISDALIGSSVGGLIELNEIGIGMISFLGDARQAANQVAAMMVRDDERQELRNYLQAYEPLAKGFNQDVATELKPRFTFQDLLDNLLAGKDLATTYSGEPHPQRQLIEDFANANTDALQRISGMQNGLSERINVSEWMKDETNAQRAYNKVKDLYGFERWETGELARSARGYRKFAQDSISADMNYHVGGQVLNSQQWQRLLGEEANALGKRLTNLLSNIKGLGADQSLSFEQLIANFKDNQPLGLMADGKPHPYAEQIEIIFNEQKSELADYVDSQWLRDKLPPQAPKDEQSAAQFITEMVGMIAESKKVWTFEELLKIGDESSVASSK
ncbi:MAG: hypothetical protein MJK13_05795 [Pseudomonadales bacterium]|nr:hypothetical protein [Pseudomonadales bacterium]